MQLQAICSLFFFATLQATSVWGKRQESDSFQTSARELLSPRYKEKDDDFVARDDTASQVEDMSSNSGKPGKNKDGTSGKNKDGKSKDGGYSSNYPPQGGNYPPQGGNYPPQGGNYPPQGGNYPPQGGNYPPQGGNYPGGHGGNGYPPHGGKAGKQGKNKDGKSGKQGKNKDGKSGKQGQKSHPGGGYYPNYPPQGGKKHGGNGGNSYPPQGGNYHGGNGGNNYPPHGGNGYPPRGVNGYPPQGRNGYPPQGGNGYPPQGGNGYPPQGGNGYPPQGGNGYPPQGRNGYPPQGGNGYPPQGGNGYPPQGGYPSNGVNGGYGGHGGYNGFGGGGFGGGYYPWRGNDMEDSPMPLFLGKLGSNDCQGGELLTDEGACRMEAARQFGTSVKFETSSTTAPKGCSFNARKSLLVFNSNLESTAGHQQMIPVCLQDPVGAEPNPLNHIFLSEINETECAGGTPVMDENDCRTDAATKLGVNQARIKSIAFHSAPGGCIFNGEKAVVIFNTDLSSTSNHARIMRVCKTES